MLLTEVNDLIAKELSVKPFQVKAVEDLLEEGNTVPFIARYRKEATGELDEEKILNIKERSQYLKNIVKRQEEIIASIEAQEKLTPELQEMINKTIKLQELEDLYLPYKPKKRTRAQVAREKGLEPLSVLMLSQTLQEGDIEAIASEYINAENELETTEAVLAGAQDIIAEVMAERSDIRALVRRLIWQNGQISTKFNEKEAASEDNERILREFLTYKEYIEPVKRIPSHRVLAVNRGEDKDALKVTLEINHEANISNIAQKIITGESIFKELIFDAIKDGYKRLLFPSIEREIRSVLTENAEKQAIKVFGINLRQLLLQAPLSGYVVLGLDPGYRTGCKAAIVDATGALIHTDVFYLTTGEGKANEAKVRMLELIKKFKVTLISIGNGTASYETEQFAATLINENKLGINYIVVNEAGASVYSASKLAKEEMPDIDVSLRGAVSIARRVQDPLSELVKIDPKSIGVGQYQHDVNQKELGSALATVVESCVNYVGVDINTASAALLTYVSGINSGLAKNIVTYRNENGVFQDRKKLMKVPRLGAAAFTQCAGFLRIVNAKNPLDNTQVHPESYPLAEKILDKLGFSLSDLLDRSSLEKINSEILKVDATVLAKELDAGEPTVRDIIDALKKPGRDPRDEMPVPVLRQNIVKLSDIQKESVVKGTVQNIVDFGVFVDIGIKVNGLIHRSELSDKPFRHPVDVVSVGDVIDVMVINVDEERNRIALSLKKVKK